MSSVFTARQNTNDLRELDLQEALCLKLTVNCVIPAMSNYCKHPSFLSKLKTSSLFTTTEEHNTPVYSSSTPVVQRSSPPILKLSLVVAFLSPRRTRD
jgi:hypothetical protein